MASVIANEFSEATGDLHLAALVQIGLALFLVTLVVNALARLLVWSITRGQPRVTAWSIHRFVKSTVSTRTIGSGDETLSGPNSKTT